MLLRGMQLLCLYLATLFVKPGGMNMEKGENFTGRVVHLKERQNKLIRTYLAVLAMLFVSYLIGLCGFSLAWMVIVAFVTFMMWRRRVAEMNDDYLREVEMSVLKKRALGSKETCEWLNFIINKWLNFSSKRISEIFKSKIDSFLDVLKPYFLNSLTFGTFQPEEGNFHMHNISSYEAPLNSMEKSLPSAQKYRMVLEASIKMHYQQFITLVAGFSGKWLGLSVEAIIEDFSLDGRVQVVANLDHTYDLPHLSSCSVSFLQKPKLHFGVRVMRRIQLMEVPFFKMWLHSFLSNTILQAFVDPGKLELSLSDVEGVLGSPSPEPCSALYAAGVLTVDVQASVKPSKDKSSKLLASEVLNEKKYCEILLGQQRYSSLEGSSPSALLSPSSSYSSSSPTETSFHWATCFLIHDLEHQNLEVIMKQHLFLSSQTMACIHLPLASFDLPNKATGTAHTEQVVERSQEEVSMRVQLFYTALQDVSLQLQQSLPSLPLTSRQAGVLSVCVHGASDLPTMQEDDTCDPYCLVYCNGSKLTGTNYVRRTSNPSWNCCSQLIVDDVSKIVLAFVVYDWDGLSVSEDDFLGSTHVVLSQNACPIRHQSFPLLTSHSSTYSDTKATIIVSVLFTPVSHLPKPFVDTGVEQAAKVQQLSTLLEWSEGIVQLHVIRAKALLAKDLNGYSDPYFEVMIGGEKKYTSDVVKKSLEPVWEEFCEVPMPTETQELQISVWDRDLISKNDFLGCVRLTRNQLLKLASDSQFEGWLKLEKVERGFIQVLFKVFTQERISGGGKKKDANNSEGSERVLEKTASGGALFEKDNRGGATARKAGTSRLDSRDSFRPSSLSQSPGPSDLDTNDGSSFFDLSRVATVTSADDSLIKSKIEQFNEEFKRSPTSVPSGVACLYKGVVVEVTLIQGLTPSSKKAFCKVKLSSAVDKRTRRLACSTAFLPAESVPLSMRFQVDGGNGERRESNLCFKIQAGLFGFLFKTLVVLSHILPQVANGVKRSVIEHDNVKLHLTCSYAAVQNV